MTRARHIGTALFALVSLTACDFGSSTPVVTQPSPTPPVASPPPAPPVRANGEITITSMTPVPGSTVPVRVCRVLSTRFCADQPELVIEVVVDRDIPNASLTVNFGGCAYGRTAVSLTADTRVSLTMSALDLSDDGPLHDGVGAKLLCELPAVTTQLIVNIWRQGQPFVPALTREFASTYTFAMP